MSKDRVILIFSCLIIGYTFLPIVFKNIPLPGVGLGSFSFYVLGLFWAKPKLFISKQLIIVYCFIIIYFLISPSNKDNPESMWLARRILPLFIGVTLYVYYFNFSRDLKGMRTIFWFTFTIILISCLTTLIGLERFPNASRELAGSVYGDLETAKFYNRIGITGYGFITALTYLIPIIVLLIQKQVWKEKKSIFIMAMILTTLTVIKAQYTTQFLLFMIALILSLFGKYYTKQNRFFILVPLITLILIPKDFYISIFDSISELVPGDILKSRLFDVSKTIGEDEILAADTHIAKRYERIPFLIAEFLKSPIFGGGRSTGHVFWLDHLSLYGLVGMVPWILIIRDNYRKTNHILRSTFIYYQIAMLMFIILGFLKGSGNREQYIILFFILPLGLFLYENGVLFQNVRKNT